MRLAININLGPDDATNHRVAADALRRLANRIESLTSLDSLPLNIVDNDGISVGECHYVASRKV